jgi:AbrB family looped-hinge helix DNA binding protein
MIDRGVIMQTVTISPKYQVVIPKEMREAMRIRPGQKLKVIEYEGRIELIGCFQTRCSAPGYNRND